MEINLGKVVSVQIRLVENPTILANVAWFLERGELKWGTISRSKFTDFWVQMPKFQLVPRDYKTSITPLKINDSALENYLSSKAIEEYKKVKGGSDDEEINLEELGL